MEVSVYNNEGKEKGKINLPEVFETKAHTDLLHEVVVGFLSNQRSGTHNTKTRGEVSGGGAKPWKQKGTGRARSGSIRSPLWRKGGIIFGPRPREYYQNLPQKKKQLALEMSLSEKAKANSLIVVEEIQLKEVKTKSIAKLLSSFKIKKNEKVLCILENVAKEIKLSSRNIQNLVVRNTKNFNAYEVLWANKIIVTKKAIEEIGTGRGVK